MRVFRMKLQDRNSITGRETTWALNYALMILCEIANERLETVRREASERFSLL